MHKDLSQTEQKRYSRHISLNDVGYEGQLKLKAAKVLVIGAGGLGCPVLQYLAASGVGCIGIVDFDIIEESNLQRQILFGKTDIGKFKAEVAAKRLNDLNEHINVKVYRERLTPDNAISIFNEFDIIIDGSDNFSTRYLVNDASILTNKPFISAAIFKFEGQVSVFNYNGGPSYRCLYPNKPDNNSIPHCSQGGVLGVLPGLIGMMQCNEALKIILGIGDVLSGKLAVISMLNNNPLYVEFERNEQEILKVTHSGLNREVEHSCNTVLNNLEISAEEFKNYSASSIIQMIDVREIWEEPEIQNYSVLRIPQNHIEDSIELIRKDSMVIIVCQSGIRSLAVANLLHKKFGLNNVRSLKAGVISLLSEPELIK